MSAESLLHAALRDLVDRRVYRDVAPPGVNTVPYITFQFVGGQSTNFLDGSAPSLENAHVQINCWDRRRDAANQLMRDASAALRAFTQLRATALSGFVATYEEDTKLYGSMQDFSIWTGSN